MKGTLITIKAGGGSSAEECDGPPTLERLQAAIGGGYIEPVPGWQLWSGQPCAVFCDEDGKRKQLPVNQMATALWNRALLRDGGPGLVTPGGKLADVLCGNVVVVTGDPEFMEAL